MEERWKQFRNEQIKIIELKFNELRRLVKEQTEEFKRALAQKGQ